MFCIIIKIGLIFRRSEFFLLFSPNFSLFSLPRRFIQTEIDTGNTNEEVRNFAFLFSKEQKKIREFIVQN